MSVTVDFIFDFGSPNAYFCHRLIPDIEAETGATFDYIPCLLGGIFKATNNQSPFMAFAGVKNKLAYEQVEMVRFINRHNLTEFKMNPNFPVNTLMIMRGAVVAKRDGYLPQYVEIVTKAMWENGLKMDDPDVVQATLTDRGLNGAAILEAISDRDVKAQLVANTETAVERGVFGIPTFFVGDDMYFGKDRLDQVKDAIMAAG